MKVKRKFQLDFFNEKISFWYIDQILITESNSNERWNRQESEVSWKNINISN